MIITIDRAVVQQALEALEGLSEPYYVLKAQDALRAALEQPEQEPVACIRSLTEQCVALVRERDELQKQVWRYEKHGVTCQTYRHHVQGCGECNNDPPRREWKDDNK
jgi:hypothetical protein